MSPKVEDIVYISYHAVGYQEHILTARHSHIENSIILSLPTFGAGSVLPQKRLFETTGRNCNPLEGACPSLLKRFTRLTGILSKLLAIMSEYKCLSEQHPTLEMAPRLLIGCFPINPTRINNCRQSKNILNEDLDNETQGVIKSHRSRLRRKHWS